MIQTLPFPRMSRGLPSDLEREIDAVTPLMSGADSANLEALLTDTPDPDAVRALVSRVRQARVRELTIHTEVSTLRLRDGEVSEDVSDVFQDVVADPLDLDADQHITDLGFEARGGATGSVQGKVVTFTFPPQKIYAHAAPEDTVLLPEGFEIRLRRGEQIVIRNAGHSTGRGALSLDAFRPDAWSVVILAEEDGVVITGPATLAPFSELCLSRLATAAPKAALKATGWHGRVGILFKPRVKRREACRASDIGLSDEEHAALMTALTLLNWQEPQGVDRSEVARSYLRRAQDAVSRTHGLRFFPARKVVTRGTAGVRTIRPQSRLTRG